MDGLIIFFPTKYISLCSYYYVTTVIETVDLGITKSKVFMLFGGPQQLGSISSVQHRLQHSGYRQ